MHLEAAVSTGGGIYAYKKKGSKASLYASSAVRRQNAEHQHVDTAKLSC